MSSETPDNREPEVDEGPPRAPGGADADLSESDVGAATGSSPVTPDVPMSAQQDQAEAPDELQTPEKPATTDGGDDDSTSAPSA